MKARLIGVLALVTVAAVLVFAQGDFIPDTGNDQADAWLLIIAPTLTGIIGALVKKSAVPNWLIPVIIAVSSAIISLGAGWLLATDFLPAFLSGFAMIGLHQINKQLQERGN